MHIININPEIFVLAYRDNKFKSVINSGDLILIDGIGIKLMCNIFNVKSGERMSGTDFMNLLVKIAAKNNKRAMFLGGKNNIANEVGESFKKKHPKLVYLASKGAKNIRKETKKEKKKTIKLVNSFKPKFLFISYGSPYQEYWVEKNKKHLKGVICFGVGGAFNLLTNRALRAPKILIHLGFEWLWRLFFEPLRLFRVLPRYVYFITIFLKLNKYKNQ